MAGRSRLGLLVAGVLALHLAALDWFARELDYGSVLQPAPKRWRYSRSAPSSSEL